MKHEAGPRGQRLLRHRDFVLLWSGQAVSDLGTAISTVVIPLIAVVSLHASAGDGVRDRPVGPAGLSGLATAQAHT
jgi:hypothetical protein